MNPIILALLVLSIYQLHCRYLQLAGTGVLDATNSSLWQCNIKLYSVHVYDSYLAILYIWMDITDVSGLWFEYIVKSCDYCYVMAVKGPGINCRRVLVGSFFLCGSLIWAVGIFFILIVFFECYFFSLTFIGTLEYAIPRIRNNQNILRTARLVLTWYPTKS